MEWIKLVARIVFALLMVSAGVLHFLKPQPFVKIVPPYLPAPHALVYISGAFEILGGVGLLNPATRQFAAYSLIALFITVFPANVHMALHKIPIGRAPTPDWVLWGRLPLQGVLIAWAWWLST